jgi:xanthine dehydrogenase accessory factor
MIRDIFEEIVQLRTKGIRAALATIIASKGATPRKDAAKMLMREDGSQIGTIGGGSVEAEVIREAMILMKTGKPKMLSFDLSHIDPEESALVCGGHMEVYLEPIFPDPTLVLFGAGHVARAVARIAQSIGFRIAVVDDRAKYANSERFPEADEFYIDSWDAALAKLPISDSSYLFIATRGHQYDLICLRSALQSSAKFIGMLGSRKKLKLLSDLLENEGMDPANFDRVIVPVGLDIGAETPEEIAVSIAAELIAARKNLDIHTLRDAVRSVRNSTAAANQQKSRH